MTLALKKTQTEPVPTAGTCAVTSLSAQQDRPCMESRALYVKSVVLAIGVLFVLELMLFMAVSMRPGRAGPGGVED